MPVKKLFVEGIVKTTLVDAQLNRLTVDLFDQQQMISGAIAATTINKKGEFKFELNSLKLKRLFQGKTPEVYLAIKKDNRLLFSTMDEIVLTLDKNISNLKIVLPKEVAESLVPVSKELPKLEVRNLLKLSGVKANTLPDIEAKLKREDLLKPESILSRPSRMTTDRTGLDENTLSQFKAIIKFAAASGSESVATKLIGKGFLSLNQLGALSYNALATRLGKLNKSEQQSLNILYQRAKNVRNDVLNHAAFKSRLDSHDGKWLLDPEKYKDDSDDDKPCQCAGCENVFSPYAYLINLLDMIHDHWELATYDLEQILLQKINEIDCDEGYKCFLQIELAIEVLETHLKTRLPLTDLQLDAEVEKIWVKLLFGSDSKTNVRLFRSLGKDSAYSNRLRTLISTLGNPGAGLTNIRKGLNELQKSQKIADLQKYSSRYAQGGDQFDAALEKAYQNVLVKYRYALIKSTGRSAEQLQKELFIDLKAGACHKTNRLTFLILSLQTFVLAGRTGQLSSYTNPDIDSFLKNKLKVIDSYPIEEANWKWLKDYTSWASAMYVFLYPENVAMPVLFEGLNDDFAKYVHKLFTSQNDRKDVFKAIYHYYFGENAREYIRTDNQHLGDQYPIFLKAVIEPGEGYFDAVKVSAQTFMRNLSALIQNYSYFYVGDWTTDEGFEVVSFEKLDNIELKNSLYFPLMAGFVLNKSEHFASAHEWYRLLYDPTQSGEDKYVFKFDHYFDETISRGERWNEGVLDPNEIVHRREGAMLRHVILMMVKNLLDWADHEFSLSTVSSLDRARQLYELAQEVLNSPDLGDECGQSIRELTIEIVTRYGIDPGTVAGTIVGTIEDLNQIDDPEIIDQAIKGIRKVLPDSGDIDPSPIETIVKKAINNYQANRSTTKLSEQIASRNDELMQHEDQILEQSAFQNTVTGVSPIFFGYSRIASPVIFHGHVEPDNASVNPITFCIPSNPVLVALDAYIKLSLRKFQLCLDITGEPLPSIVVSDESVAEFFDTIDAEVERQPLLDLPANWFNEPPRYRYTYLIEKARQYVDVAQRMGSALLTAQVNFDNERFGILKAQHAIELASSTIDLRNLGLKDTLTGLKLANLQSNRAEFQMKFWDNRIDEGMLSEFEQIGLGLMITSAALNATAGAIQGIGAIFAAVGGGIAGGAGGGVGGGALSVGVATAATAIFGTAAGGVIGGAVAAALPGTVGALGSFASAAGTLGSTALSYAGFERRFEDWNLQRDLSEIDFNISKIQIDSATNRIDIADQELSISELQHTQNKEVLGFLENKFSNDHLYEWMIQVLSQNYRTLMQISANVAKLAQRALEFERQQKISIIVGDYWSVNTANAFSGNLSEEQKDSGLLGAERLLTDLTRLDAFKLSTEKRRLQLSKTISMAQMLPGELAILKSSGKIVFNTLLHWFDRDFPGHYLRLIKSVKISILALTPPIDGIHATLSNSGESTVVVHDGVNHEIKRAFRDFGETIALDSPFNETGLFIFDYNDPMFLPFEGLGVETQWVLELPKASNRFNFDTLIDVMLTIEYTALHNDLYAETVRTQLGTSDINDIPLNVRSQFPDEWYHFKNDPVAADGTRKFTIQLPQQFLPPHYETDTTVSTIQITVFLMGNFSDFNQAQKDLLLESIGIEHEYEDNNVQKTLFVETKFKTRVIEANNSQYALFSTRDNNDQSVQLEAGINPIGDWKISIKDINLPDNATLGELLDDILIVVTTQGEVTWG